MRHICVLFGSVAQVVGCQEWDGCEQPLSACKDSAIRWPDKEDTKKCADCLLPVAAGRQSSVLCGLQHNALWRLSLLKHVMNNPVGRVQE